MKNSDITTISHSPGEPPIVTDTDWRHIDALTDAELHEAALSDPDAMPLPEIDNQGLTKLVNVRKLRERLHLTQEAFAATYRIPIGTLRDWEQRRKRPDGPARAYLMVIAADPAAVAGLLRHAA